MSEEMSFWDGVEQFSGKKLSSKEKLQFCEDFTQMLRTSPELAKIFFNTQVYNEIVNDVTTRGLHSEGVAIVAENLATQKAKLDGKDEINIKVSGLLARALGYMHDLGHTPFGHDGEGALGNEMERFKATEEYKMKRKVLFGKEYTIQAGDAEVETMCYEHNETSAIIGSQLIQKFAEENGYVLDEQAIQYIKTGILAHSTSRVKEEPNGVEQKAVRLADKVAYIPQDLLDLIKQNVLVIDDLSPEEQALLGLNERKLTDKENEMYESLTSEEDKKKYLESRSKNKQELKDKLRKVDKMPDKIKISLFKQLDVKVAEMQAEIAKKCFAKRNGQMQLYGGKEIVDVISDYVNKGELPEIAPNQTRPLTSLEQEGAKLFEEMRDAQKHRKKIGMKINEYGIEEPIYENIQFEGQKQAIDDTSKAYCQYLKEKRNMNSTLATLWVTKAKYQDAFIYGDLARVSQDQNGRKRRETLAEINKRNENGWKMKTAFQFFYANIDQIPQEFREKYQGAENDLYTDQQLVSSFIASFTNKGLDELYNGLLDRKLVISRDAAISQLQAQRPDLDVKAIVGKDKKWKNPQNLEETHKVSANDVLEFLYEENVGSTIVSGKNQIPERSIPQIQHAIAVRDGVNATRNVENQEISQEPQLLSSTIEISKTQVNSRDIQGMVKNIRDRQNSQEIQQHIDEVSKDEGR